LINRFRKVLGYKKKKLVAIIYIKTKPLRKKSGKQSYLKYPQRNPNQQTNKNTHRNRPIQGSEPPPTM
jgi:hypothetical protein